MARLYFCRGCAGPGQRQKWKGPCPNCYGFWSIVAKGSEEEAENDSLAALSVTETEYIKTGVDSFDHVIGGGLVAGSCILFGGPAGTGKTTLTLSVADSLARRTKRPVLYASGEQKKEDVGKIAHRAGISSDLVRVMGNACSIEDIIDRARELKPIFAILDSLQVITCDDVKGEEGSIAQGLAVANIFTAECKHTEMCGLIINHITRSGSFAGSMSVEHLVDTVLVLDEDPDFDAEGFPILESKDNRMLSILQKNRNGDPKLTARFKMSAKGLQPIKEKRTSKLLHLRSSLED